MKHRYVANGIPFLRSQNARANRFDPDGLLYIPSDFHEELGKSRLEPDDVVIVRSGSVGTACVIPAFLNEANCSDLVIIKQPLGLEPTFGAYYMNSAATELISNEKVGVALIHLNTQSVAAMPVPLPPESEQARIVAEIEQRLSRVDALELAARQQSAKATQLRAAVLRSAFSGKLVPQDPKDEPASALLQRVHAERSQQALGKPVRKARSKREKAAAVEA